MDPGFWVFASIGVICLTVAHCYCHAYEIEQRLLKERWAEDEARKDKDAARRHLQEG